MRQTILAAARDVFVREGYENASIRKIAERIDYSGAAIYRYFGSKEDIFFAIAETGFRLLHRSVNAVRSSDPVETLRRRFWRYYEFSKAQPEYFALMFVDRSVPRIRREWDRFTFMQTTRENIRDLVRRCIERGAFPPGTDADVVFHILATVIHGAAAVRLSDRLVPRGAADALARDVLETALQGLRHGVATTFVADNSFHSVPRGVRCPVAGNASAPPARSPRNRPPARAGAGDPRGPKAAAPN